MPSFKKTLAGLAVIAATTGAVATTAGSAEAAPAAKSAQVAGQQVLAQTCTVNDNGVNYRGGPGTDYPVLGQVNRGQNIDVRGVEGNWAMGDLWGGTTGVWIHVAYLDC
ncbi:SH3 domain-containing protein [Streptomyces sp. T-3]|nr:SH3 domain-containing protein [Streptomyces sp. T-3]